MGVRVIRERAAGMIVSIAHESDKFSLVFPFVWRASRLTIGNKTETPRSRYRNRETSELFSLSLSLFFVSFHLRFIIVGETTFDPWTFRYPGHWKKVIRSVYNVYVVSTSHDRRKISSGEPVRTVAG